MGVNAFELPEQEVDAVPVVFKLEVIPFEVSELE